MTLIDPLVPRPFGSQEPPMLKSSLSTFTASHLLAFGTDYGLFAYLRELEARLAAGDRFKFATSDDFYNALIPDLIERGRSWEAVKHYLDSRGLPRAIPYPPDGEAEPRSVPASAPPPFPDASVGILSGEG